MRLPWGTGEEQRTQLEWHLNFRNPFMNTTEGTQVFFGSSFSETDHPDSTTDSKYQVVFTHNSLSQVTKSEPSHADVVGAGTSSVQYAYNTSASGSVFDDGPRLESLTYRSGRDTIRRGSEPLQRPEDTPVAGSCSRPSVSGLSDKTPTASTQVRRSRVQCRRPQTAVGPGTAAVR